MNPADLQALRVAIAKSEGWTRVEVYEWKDGVRVARQWHDIAELPAFTESRNDIVGAVLRRFVTEEEQRLFGQWLFEMTRKNHESLASFKTCFALATAEALTLCRAYVAAAGISVEGV